MPGTHKQVHHWQPKFWTKSVVTPALQSWPHITRIWPAWSFEGQAARTPLHV